MNSRTSVSGGDASTAGSSTATATRRPADPPLAGRHHGRVLVHERHRAGVVQEIGHLRAGEPVADGHDHGAHPAGSVPAGEDLGTVAEHHPDPVAVSHALGREVVGPPVGGGVEVGKGDPPPAGHQGQPVAVSRRRWPKSPVRSSNPIPPGAGAPRSAPLGPLGRRNPIGGRLTGQRRSAAGSTPSRTGPVGPGTATAPELHRHAHAGRRPSSAPGCPCQSAASDMPRRRSPTACPRPPTPGPRRVRPPPRQTPSGGSGCRP